MSWKTVTFVKNSCTKEGKEGYEKMKVYMPKGSIYEDYYFSISPNLVLETTETIRIALPPSYEFVLIRGKNRTEKKYPRVTLNSDDFEEFVSGFKPEFNRYLAEVKTYRNNQRRSARQTIAITLEIGSLEGKWFWIGSIRRRVDSRGVTILKKLTPEEVELYHEWKNFNSRTGNFIFDLKSEITDLKYARDRWHTFPEYVRWTDSSITTLNNIISDLKSTEVAMRDKLLKGVEV